MKLLKSVSLPTSSTALKTVNVLFEDKIIKLSTDEIEVEEDVQIIDAKGLLMLPGGIDPHTHILAKNADAATDLAKITKIALEGGWTTLAELSYHTQSPVFNNSALKKKIALVNANSFTSLALWGHIDIGDYPYHAESAQEIWSKGIVGIALAVPSPNPAIPDITFTEIMDLFFDIYESDTSFAFQGYDYESYQEFSPLAQL
ncbi:MAG: amidohydrolase family protein, partial [Candidatus Cloacimonas acidaminovorans]|nr:amidohydrolase family protein [Candidatus Cloacimonas acidaminovorans]